MVIDLLVHEVSPEEEPFERRQPLPTFDGEHPLTARELTEAERAEQPVEIVEPVAHAGHVAVAEQVIGAVDVEHAADAPR